MARQQKDASNDLATLVQLLGHDVRNSVRALVEIPKWIEEDLKHNEATLPGQVGEHFDLIATQATRLDKMINDLIAFSQIERPCDLGFLDLDGTVESAIAKVHLPEGFSVSHDLQGAQLRIAEQDLLAVVTELISNAVKHHHADTGAIAIKVQSTGHGFEMTITDDGPGVPCSHLEQIFLPMKTMRPRDDVEGSGMGLSIARRIIESYGGTLTAIERKQGCGFRISIPHEEAQVAVIGSY